MRYSFFDRYSDRSSLIHRLDPRAKLIVALLFILAVILTSSGSWTGFAAYLAIISGLLLSSRVPPSYVLKRSLVILPFVIMLVIFLPFAKGTDVAASYNIWLWRITITHTGINILVNVLIKAWLSSLALIWLTATTSITRLLYGMERLHLPKVLIMILSLMYRYVFVLIDEAVRMKQARDSRGSGGTAWLRLRTTGNMIGTLFIRSYERGERIYEAMVARGFAGEVRTFNRLSFRLLDAEFLITCSLILLLVGVFSRIR
jgi:cobalt/nickel transport system permease protein